MTKEENLLIEGFGLSNYYSFGELQRIAPCGKMNILIGKNNCGKSNILRYLRDRYIETCRQIKNGNGTPKIQDTANRNGNFKTTASFGLNVGSEKFEKLLNSKPFENYRDTIVEIFESDIVSDKKNYWFDYDLETGAIEKRFAEELTNSVEYNIWRVVAHAIGLRASNVALPNAIAFLKYFTSLVFFSNPDENKIVFISETRDLLKEKNASHEIKLQDYNGTGAIKTLSDLQNPPHDNVKDYEEKRQKFVLINSFLREVLGDKKAELEVNSERTSIGVRLEGRIAPMPISNLGHGIHEAIMFSIIATTVSNSIICIEEPELHLHPELQRKLMSYLFQKTDNQYFITTHSAHIMDTAGANIFHITYENGQSKVRHTLSDNEKLNICSDLGYKASDLLQANCIIWGEGPSDRIYINHWIKSLDDELIEGIHYSIMFYGGKLLSHLTADIDEEEIEKFISLRKINQKMCIVMDSDKTSSRKNINDTKKRIEQEFEKEKNRGFAWITKGREIENYIPENLVKKALQDIHNNVNISSIDTSQYGQCWKYKTNGQKDDNFKNADKLRIAHYIAEQEADLDMLDLKVRIPQLVSFIKNANALEN